MLLIVSWYLQLCNMYRTFTEKSAINDVRPETEHFSVATAPIRLFHTIVAWIVCATLFDESLFKIAFSGFNLHPCSTFCI